MKQLIVFMPSFKAGGAQRVLSIIMNRMAKEGHQVMLALIKENAPIEYILDEKIEIVRNQNFSRNKIKNSILEVLFIRKVLKKRPNANALSFITMFNLYTILAAFGLENNVVVSERNDPRHSFEKGSGLWENLRKHLYARANHVVFQTEEAQAYFSGCNGIKGTIIPNPLSEDLPVKTTYDDPNNIVAIARLEEQKNYPLMMEAMNDVAKKHPEFRLLIYGKGNEEENLKAYWNGLENKDNIEFMGFTDNVPAVLLHAYAYISSSDYEGISNSMLEALAIGVPCICTDCPSGGARRFIKDHVNGLLVPVKDRDALSSAITEMIEHPENRENYGHKSVSIRNELNTSTIYDMWYSLFV